MTNMFKIKYPKVIDRDVFYEPSRDFYKLNEINVFEEEVLEKLEGLMLKLEKLGLHFYPGMLDKILNSTKDFMRNLEQPSIEIRLDFFSDRHDKMLYFYVIRLNNDFDMELK